MADQEQTPRPAPDDSGFGALNDAHTELEELLLVHQECLLVGAFASAAELLAAYRELVTLHIAHEEQRVLPIYERAEEKRWPAELYTGQHKKILALLDRIEPMVAELTMGPGWRRRVLSVLEHETTLKHLLEHHHLAEDQVFYPVANEHTTGDECRGIVETCAAEWEAAASRHADALTRARAQVPG